MVKYDQWLNSGKIDFSSKVIPINESIEAEQWVLPTEQALEILRKARTVALTNCACRTHYRRCDKPVEVCLTLNETGEKEIAQGLARPITLSEAAKVLRKANENGQFAMHFGRHDCDDRQPNSLEGTQIKELQGRLVVIFLG